MSTSPLHTVRFQADVRVFTCGLPEDTIVDLTASGTHHMYATCWIDGERGRSAHVVFPEATGSQHSGTFTLDLPYRESGDSNALKIQFCMRMLDTDSHNRRSAEICMGHAWADKMLAGETDRFRVANQFTDGNYINVEMRALNASDFRNHSGQASDNKPLLTFSATKLALLAQGNEDMELVTKEMKGVLKKNSAGVPDDGAGFMEGMTRFLLFFSLCLGTPAYALISLQSTVRREAEHRHRQGRKPAPQHALCGAPLPDGQHHQAPPPPAGPVPHVPQGGPFRHDDPADPGAARRREGAAVP